jgi:hypothetical protein
MAMGNGNCKCEACGARFYSMTAFDMHCTGSYASGRAKHTRRCLTVKEMRAKGMRPSDKGVWNSGQFQRRVAQLEIWPSPEKVPA